MRRNGKAADATMNGQLLYPEYPAFLPELTALDEDTHRTFFKCVRWQLEETLDPTTCPYHYFCDSTYLGNYPPAVDALVFLFTTASYLATLVIMVIEISGRGRTSLSQSKRCFLPSGPILLPIILLVLAKGLQINTIFPVVYIGPAILQLVHVSALTFHNGAKKSFNYVFFEASTISGILHASIYLDSVILPYYTGLDALLLSSFSGECASCVCRKEALVVGGVFDSYRAWSLTTVVVVGVLCLRILSRLSGKNNGKIILAKRLLETLGWICIIMDCVHLIKNSPPETLVLVAASFGGIIVLICLHVIKLSCIQITQLQAGDTK